MSEFDTYYFRAYRTCHRCNGTRWIGSEICPCYKNSAPGMYPVFIPIEALAQAIADKIAGAKTEASPGDGGDTKGGEHG